jgi:hypothetical protein
VKKKKGGYGTASSPFSSCAGGEGHCHMQKREKPRKPAYSFYFLLLYLTFFLMFLGFFFSFLSGYH